MASDIATASTDAGAPVRSSAPASGGLASAEPGRRSRWRGWLSPLTGRIVGVNVLALALLGVGLLYVGQYEASLIETELEALKTQGEIFAAALGEGAVIDSVFEGERLVPELGRQMMRRLVEPTRTRARLFDLDGSLIADSRALRGVVGSVQIRELPPLQPRGLTDWLASAYDNIVHLLPSRTIRPPYVEPAFQSAIDYPEVVFALGGDGGRAVRTDPRSGRLILSVAVPVQRYKHIVGAVLLSIGSAEIENAIRAVRLDILKVFLIALAATVFLSLYLAGTIARPVRRLAAAADRVRRGSARKLTIPDMTQRGDEIGDLSGALRDMTGALWQRMDAIERFAADVAHEIKNPLSSLRSAVETVARIEDPEKQRRLMAIILEDVQRLDRLISDISDASRLDAEMSRVEPAPVAVDRLLATLAEVYEATGREGAPGFIVEPARAAEAPRRDLVVAGVEDRLVQVLRNLIANAISFSPPGGTIRLRAERDGSDVVISVEDDGPGIPEGKLEAVFDRFYSERPAGEKFGTHSGLGLAISRQIVEAHRGTIRAENRRDPNGKTIGANFRVRIPAA